MRKLAQLKLYDIAGNILANQSDIQVAWFDQPEPKDFASVVYKSGVLTTNPAGRLSVDIDAATSLGVSDSGFLLAYKLNTDNHQDSLVFAGRMAVELGLATEAYLLDGGDLGFVANLRDFSTLFQDSAGATPVTAIGQSVGRINSANGSGVYASTPTSSKKPILRRVPVENNYNLLSSPRDVSNANDWSGFANWSAVSVEAYSSGGVSWRCTQDNVSGRSLGKINTGASDGKERTLVGVFEKSSGESVVETEVALRDGTTLAYVGRVKLTWSSGAVAIIAGDGGASKLSDSGPNGGAVYKIWCTGIIPAGNQINRYLFLTGTGANTHTIIAHETYLYESARQINYLDYDGVDDELVLNNPDLGTNATRIRAQLGGSVIESGLTLGANLTLNTDNLGLILINRALTADELTAITNFYNEMVL